jgi:hypothetical protein
MTEVERAFVHIDFETAHYPEHGERERATRERAEREKKKRETKRDERGRGGAPAAERGCVVDRRVVQRVVRVRIG